MLLTSLYPFKRGFFKSVQLIVLMVVCPILSVAQQWQAIPPMHFAREEAAAVTLLDGRVLIAGGNDGSNALSSCELYDPNTNTWAMTGSMNEPRWRFTMIRLLDGRVFVAGGITGPVTDYTVATTAGCEIYDPKSGQWKEVAHMSEARENFPLLLLPNGKVFMNGGLDANNGTYLSLTETFDPSTNSIQVLAPSPVPFFGQVAFYDSIHHQVLIQGGSNGGVGGLFWNTSQIYDIASNTWSYGPPSLAEHDTYCSAVMPDNSLVLLGGRESSYVAHDSIEVLRPPYTRWEFLGYLTSPRWHGGVLRVNNDSIIDIGGNDDPGVNSDAFDSTNWFDYSRKRTIQGPRMLQARSVFVDALAQLSTECVDSTVILVFGGLSKDSYVLNSCERLVIGSSTVTKGPSFLHRSVAVSYFGREDSLALLVDVNPAINVDSLWPYLTEIQATYSWDSSVVSFAGYQPPSGWVINSIVNHRNSLDLDIENNGSMPTQPLDLGTALFLPRAAQLATTWVDLPVLTLSVGGNALPLCTSQNEDNHWTVKTLGAPSLVGAAATATRDIALYPNPVGDDLFVSNPPGAGAASVTLYDAIGRVVARARAADGVTASIDVHSLASGVYFARIERGGAEREQVVVRR